MSDRFDPSDGSCARSPWPAASSVTAEVLSNQPRKDVRRNTLFASLLFFAIAIALAGLIWLIADSLIEGCAAPQRRPLHEPEFLAPARRGASVGDHTGRVWIMSS